MKTGGQLLVECLIAQDVERIFCVPGESYLAVLDALFDHKIDVINARQESGAAMMAEADGKMTGRPGICMVTRGPGATNAAAGIHIAKQDSTPMIMFVGQIGRAMRGREAFQEVDYRQTFRDLAKWVEEIDQAERIPEIINHAWHVTMSGRPGPVVLALPEDMLRDVVSEEAGPYVDVADPAPSQDAITRFEALVAESASPFLILGGSRWRSEDVKKAHDFAERLNLPVGCSFRRQQLFDHTHPHYAGDVGLGINPKLRAQLDDSDLIISLGAKLSEIPSQDFGLMAFPKPQQKFIHIQSGPEELGRIYTPTLAINATPGTFLDATKHITRTKGLEHVSQAHQIYTEWTDVIPIPGSNGSADIGFIFDHMRQALPSDAIMTNGAGNYAAWLHRFWRFRQYGTQLAPTSGSMGYGLPAAIAAKLRHRERIVICLAGDGCFQMTSQEFASAVQTGARVIVIVLDNGIYGTIRMHQERHYPHRVSATNLQNPDFAALARACHGFGVTVTSNDAFPQALDQALASETASLIHVKTDPEAITPSTTLTELQHR